MIIIPEKIYANNTLINKLINSYNNNLLPNSMIFSGTKGTGKKTQVFSFIISLFKKIVKNEIKKHSNLILNNTHPNVRYIQRLYDEKNEKLRSFIAIDQIRSLENFIYQSSFDNLPKFIILDSADYLNRSSSNALLKILEEPKKNTYFILISHQISILLPTIRSRCIKFYFEKIDYQDFNKILNINTKNLNEENLNFLYNLTNGSPGLAIKINEKKIDIIYDNIINILIKNQSLSLEIINLANKVSKFTNDEYKIFFILLRFVLITITKMNLGLDLINVLSNNLYTNIKKAAHSIKPLATLEILEYLNDNEKDLFTYNLDKKIFCINIFKSLGFVK